MAPTLEPPDEPQESAFRGMDDAQVVAERLHGPRFATARVELERRKRLAAQWCGEWMSGPYSPVPPPPPQYRHLVNLGERKPWKKPFHQSLKTPIEREARRGPLPAVEVLDGRLNRCQREFIPHNPTERFQANIVRFSKLSDSELRQIAMKRTSPESKAARHVMDWRSRQPK